MRGWKITAGLLFVGLTIGWCMEWKNEREQALNACGRLKKIHLFF